MANDYIGPNEEGTHCFRFSVNSLNNLLVKITVTVEDINRYFGGEFLVSIAKKRRYHSATNKIVYLRMILCLLTSSLSVGTKRLFGFKRHKVS